MKPITDEELVTAVRNGSISSYEILVRRYHRPLVSFILRLTGDHRDAEELAQDVLFSVYRTIDRVDTGRRFSTYLFAMAKNAAFSRLRSAKRTVPLTEDTLTEDDTYLLERLYRKEAAGTVRTAVARLPRKFREVIMLYYFRDLSYEEIAGKLKIPVNTVRTYLRRAKETLKGLLPHENE